MGIPTAPDADVAVEFSVPSAIAENLPKLAARQMNVVIGTTGWHEHEERMKRIAADAGIGVVAASNFSLGVALFQCLAEQAAKMFAPYPRIRRVDSRDSPLGKEGCAFGYGDYAAARECKRLAIAHNIDMASSRAGSVPGTHTIGFDGPFETITMTHTNRDRAAFAQGALQAAKWVQGKRGWFTIRDVLGL